MAMRQATRVEELDGFFAEQVKWCAGEEVVRQIRLISTLETPIAQGRVLQESRRL